MAKFSFMQFHTLTTSFAIRAGSQASGHREDLSYNFSSVFPHQINFVDFTACTGWPSPGADCTGSYRSGSIDTMSFTCQHCDHLTWL
jgi:hypothetical protein